MAASTTSIFNFTVQPASRRRPAPCRAGIHIPTSKIGSMVRLDGLKLRIQEAAVSIAAAPSTELRDSRPSERVGEDGCLVQLERMHAVIAAAADRAEMHAIIGVQRDNWNKLFVGSVNSLSLAGSLLAGLSTSSPNVLAFKLSSGVLLATAAAVMAVASKIQPSQLAEEQRNAARLWRALENDLRTEIAMSPAPTRSDVKRAIKRVIALDKAYPLPLLPSASAPGMLNKFAEAIEPTRWWPKKTAKSPKQRQRGGGSNGWSPELEKAMKGVSRVMKAKDQHEYLGQANLGLGINRAMAVAGPTIAGLSALAAMLIGESTALGSWASAFAMVGGAAAAAVNTLEHGGQVGMVLEMFRNCAGSFEEMQEEIECALGEGCSERRENGEVFATKIALRLGRSVSELAQFAAYDDGDEIEEMASRIF